MLLVQTKPLFFEKTFPRTRAALLGTPVALLQKTSKKRAKTKLPAWFLPILNIFLSTLIGLSILIGSILIIPGVYYFFFPADIVELEPPEVASPLGGEYTTEQTIENKEEYKYVPDYDETLPDGDWISIPLIGVKTELRPTEKPEEALEKGVWWVPDFGVAGDTELPMIVAAHRFGWQWWWQSDYWKYNSFYLLPEVQPGDRVEIISDHRKWEYEVYAGEEGQDITDYDADLILYTCKYLQSPVRHFRYARLLDPTQNTQE